MKKVLFLYAGLLISAMAMFGQEVPKLNVTERDMDMVVFRCAGDNETVVEVKSIVPLSFESTMDKAISSCSTREENGFYFYELLFKTGTEYKGRKLKIKSYGFDTYTQPLDLKSKVPVGLLIMREADALYNAGNFSEALKEYEKLYSINPKDEHVERRINQCNEKINGNKITAEGKKQDLTFVFKGVKNNSLVILYLDNHLIGETNFAKGFQLKYMDVKPGAHELHVVCANLEWNDIIHTIEKTVFTFEYKNKKTGFGYKSSLELVK